MATTLKASAAQVNRRSYPHTLQLPDDRTVFVEVPGEMVRFDRSGEMGFTAAGMEFLDRIQAMAMEIGDRPTAAHIRALRAALDLTQAQFGQEVGVDKLTVSRWERGEVAPGAAAVARLGRLRKRAAAHGTVIPIRSRGRRPVPRGS